MDRGRQASWHPTELITVTVCTIVEFWSGTSEFASGLGVGVLLPVIATQRLF